MGPPVSHLLFADDCILLGLASIRNAESYASIINCYCQASGQKINLNKSSICFSPKTSRAIRDVIHQVFGIVAKTDGLSYLGIPITGRRPRISDFSMIERRIRDRIDEWQITSLSMMARITLIRSVLTSLPMHLLSNAVVPITCLRRVERWFRDFLWASTQDDHGMHLQAWDLICMPLNEGGLGIQSLLVRREVLMARHASRFLLDPHGFWSSFMRARYGEWSSDMDLLPSRRCSFFWKEVCRHAPSIRSNITWMIGDGSVVDVMQDSWIADLPLSRWPSFISMDVPQHMMVRDLISPSLSYWNTSVITRLFGEELARRILSIPLALGHIPDTRLWRRSCLPKAPSRDLIGIYSPQSRDSRDAKWVWRLPVHPRVQLFIWKILWDCLPSCSLLSSRGLHIEAVCPLCGQEVETIDHAIFRCPILCAVWTTMGYDCTMDESGSWCSPFLQALRTTTAQHSARWAITAYQIWLSRNKLIFTNETISPRRLIQKIRAMLTETDSILSSTDFSNLGLWSSPAALAANRCTVFISWELPPPGFVKINFDGSVRDRMAGSAFIIRGPDGAMVAAGGFGSLDSSVPMAELYAAWAGISYAVRYLHAQHLIVEGDSLTVIRWIRGGDCEPSNPICRDIQEALRGLPSVHIRHIYREANAAADWIAAAVGLHAGYWSWNQGDPCPSALKQILYSDSSGLTRTRMV